VTSDWSPEVGAFERSREKRLGVRRASADLEEVLARPAAQDPKVWSAQTADCLQLLAEAFQVHARHSEGPEGLLAEILAAAPRLANAVERIKRDHEDILIDLSALQAETRGNEDMGRIPLVREQALGVLQAIAAHRQRGADLIYEAYSVDIEAGD
jgi:hypothetical protein